MNRELVAFWFRQQEREPLISRIPFNGIIFPPSSPRSSTDQPDLMNENNQPNRTDTLNTDNISSTTMLPSKPDPEINLSFHSNINVSTIPAAATPAAPNPTSRPSSPSQTSSEQPISSPTPLDETRPSLIMFQHSMANLFVSGIADSRSVMKQISEQVYSILTRPTTTTLEHTTIHPAFQNSSPPFVIFQNEELAVSRIADSRSSADSQRISFSELKQTNETCVSNSTSTWVHSNTIFNFINIFPGPSGSINQQLSGPQLVKSAATCVGSRGGELSAISVGLNLVVIIGASISPERMDQPSLEPSLTEGRLNMFYQFRLQFRYLKIPLWAINPSIYIQINL